ncbi:hypothetical protein [Nostoc sp. ChiQUE01b]|uniref:hypothetical protein n=1 Tax=Nostoc sp. ChiQUE01b TaxID=3075376 RepID=UPI002AD5A288|nr:hypothetical protein [Nostoc sp. ChiQUE01b]MDZ8258023.1 hypothetical protein [Nostoc sp. ChiQUE01b]
MPNCNASDASLSADLSIRINDSLVPNDPVWWLSPDIKLFRLGAGGSEISDGNAILDGDNYVDVRVSRIDKPLLADTFDILVELWVCNPSLSMSPLVETDTRRLFTGTIRATSLPVSSSIWLSSILPPQGQVTAAPYPTAPGIPLGNVGISRDASGRIKWIPNPQDSVQQKGHKCLIARVYQDALSDPKPDNDCFHAQADDHVAQRNLEIVEVAPKIKSFSFPIQTTGLSLDAAEGATIRAIADRVPSAAVLNTILPSLKQFKGFRQIAQIAPERFALQVPEKFSPVIRDNSRLEKITPINPGNIPFRDNWRYVFRDEDNRFGRFRDVVFNPNVVLQEAVADRKFNAPLNVRNLQVTPNLQVAPKLNITPKLAKLVEQAAPTFEADIKLPPKEVANFTFTANLPENSQPGDAHIFHVMHINDQKQVIGGLTIVAVVVESLNI